VEVHGDRVELEEAVDSLSHPRFPELAAPRRWPAIGRTRREVPSRRFRLSPIQARRNPTDGFDVD